MAAGKEAKISKNYYGGIEKMLFLYYPKCSTCQKAKKWLDANHISYEERHIVEENPTYEELKLWYENGDLPLKKFFNTSGMLYKEQKLKDKLPDMSEEEQLRLLATDGMLVKRPLIVKENLVLTGFKEKEWTEKLLLGLEKEIIIWEKLKIFYQWQIEKTICRKSWRRCRR